jgi:DNA-binding LytR/AlgR family response regulator
VNGLRVLAVDDERPALDDLARVLRRSPGVAHVHVAASGGEALQVLAQRPFDAVFLDVRMPGLDGVELARVLRRFAKPPALVFVSAYESAAVEAFELRAIDYLMKPVSRARVEEALARITAEPPEREAEPEPQAAPAAEADVVPVATLRGGGTRLLPRSTILYLQAHGDYVRIVSDDGRFLMRSRLSDIERRWEPHGFVRVHRRYVVNLRRAVEVRPQLNGTAVLVFADGSEVPIARRQVADLRRRLRA